MIKTSWERFMPEHCLDFFYYNPKSENWENIDLPVSEERVVDLVEINNQLFVLTRSHLLKKTEIGLRL